MTTTALVFLLLRSRAKLAGWWSGVRLRRALLGGCTLKNADGTSAGWWARERWVYLPRRPRWPR